MQDLPWHIWRDAILPVTPTLQVRLICRRFEIQTRQHLHWIAPPVVYGERSRDRIMCVQRLLFKNPTYASIGGENCESFLLHFICSRLEQNADISSELRHLVICNRTKDRQIDVLRIIALLRRCSCLETLEWTSIDEDDEIPWEIMRPTLETITCFTSSVVSPIIFMPNLRALHVVGTDDEPAGIESLRRLRDSLLPNNRITTICFGCHPEEDIDMRHENKAARIVGQILQKCRHIQFLRMTSIAIAVGLLSTEQRRQVHLEVVARVVVVL